MDGWSWNIRRSEAFTISKIRVYSLLTRGRVSTASSWLRYESGDTDPEVDGPGNRAFQGRFDMFIVSKI